jgi:hypothetical protein
MKKLLITILATVAFAIPFFSLHTPLEEQHNEPNYYRGCVASAHQATTRGIPTDLEAELIACEKLK